MATIKTVKEFKKENGKKSWKFTMSDGTVGYTANDKPWEYKEGDEVSYTVEDKGTYKILTFTRLSNAPVSPPAPPPAPPEQKSLKSDPPVSSRLALIGNTLQGLKAEACMRAMEYVIGAFRDERITWEQVGEKQKECAGILCSELDGIFTDKA